MTRLGPLLVLALAGCSSAPVAPGGPEPLGADLDLPPASGPLEFAPDQTEFTLAWCLGELARLTGQELVIPESLRAQLEQAKERLESTRPVPAGELYGFAEALLVRENAVLMPLKGGTRPVLGVFSGPEQFFPATRCVPVSVDRLPEIAEHPALVVQLVLTLEHTDARQLQNQLRPLMVDSTGLQQVIPAGERSLVLRGPGAKIADLTRLLLEVDRVSAARAPVAETPTKD